MVVRSVIPLFRVVSEDGNMRRPTAGALLCVRPSSEDPDWGGPGSVLNIGMNDAAFVEFSDRIGADAASALYMRFVMGYAIHVARLDPDVFDDIATTGQQGLSDALRAYEEEAEEPFPQDPARQLAEVLRTMARAWEGTTARLLRQAKGAPVDAGLGLVVQVRSASTRLSQPPDDCLLVVATTEHHLCTVRLVLL